MKNPSYFSIHERNFENNLYVYPVISRRSEGLSIGINLSQIKECNFACEYCQVDRIKTVMKDRRIDLNILKNEIEILTELALSKELFSYKEFKDTPEKFRLLKDISFSGDGESTANPFFQECAELIIQFIEKKRNEGIFIAPIVITNGTMLHKIEIVEILKRMDLLGGGAWVKLDAGTESEFHKICETNFSFEKIKSNIIFFSKSTPVILQSILYRYSNGNLSFKLNEYIDCINEMLKSEAKFKYIQLYTLARASKIKDLNSVSEEELFKNSIQIKEKTGVDVKIFS